MSAGGDDSADVNSVTAADDVELEESLASKIHRMKEKLAARRHERTSSEQTFKSRLEAKLTSRPSLTLEDSAAGRFSCERRGAPVRMPTGDTLPANRHGPVVSVLPVSGRSWLDAIIQSDCPQGWCSRETNPQARLVGHAVSRACVNPSSFDARFF